MTDREEILRSTFAKFESQAPTNKGLAQSSIHRANVAKQRRQLLAVLGSAVVMAALVTTTLNVLNDPSPAVTPGGNFSATLQDENPCDSLLSTPDYGVTDILATYTSTSHGFSGYLRGGLKVDIPADATVCAAHATNLAPPGPTGGEATADTILVVISPEGSLSVLAMGTKSGVMAEFNQIAGSHCCLDLVQYPPLSNETLKTLQGSGDLDAVILDATEVDPTIDAGTAIQAAWTSVFDQPGVTIEISLVNATVQNYGKEISDDPSVSKLDLIIDHETEWLIVVRNAQLQSFGGPVRTNQDGPASEKPSYDTGNFYTMIDPNTGDFVRSSTFG